MKKVLFAVYNAPAGSIWINEALRSAFGMYGEDLEPVILFLNEAVLAVRKQCKPEIIECLPLSITFKYLEKYNTQVYAVKEELEKYSIEENEIEPHWNLKTMIKEELPEFVHSFDKVVFF